MEEVSVLSPEEGVISPAWKLLTLRWRYRAGPLRCDWTRPRSNRRHGKRLWQEFKQEPEAPKGRALRRRAAARSQPAGAVQPHPRPGKGGKTVTVISGWSSAGQRSQRLLKRLKTPPAAGTLKQAQIELQGDQSWPSPAERSARRPSGQSRPRLTWIVCEIAQARRTSRRPHARIRPCSGIPAQRLIEKVFRQLATARQRTKAGRRAEPLPNTAPIGRLPSTQAAASQRSDHQPWLMIWSTT